MAIILRSSTLLAMFVLITAAAVAGEVKRVPLNGGEFADVEAGRAILSCLSTAGSRIIDSGAPFYLASRTNSA